MEATPGAAATRWRQVRCLFEGACELPEPERGEWLAARGGGDLELLAEVRELLAADAGERALEPPPLPAPGLRGAGAAERAGMQVGPYRLVRLIGSGGMGAVYLARRADDVFEKEVAVKLIKRGMDTDDILGRFRTERQVLAGMEHPGVARLLDGGSTEDGLPYLVMELVEGVALDRWCDERLVGVRGRIELFREVCEAVDFAHRRGVVHRDLKPTNVLVDGEGRPKLLDFGIAKILEPAGSSATVDVTATELRLMTPEYASPEQVRGEPVGPPADVYSLGAMLYELLTGRRPHPTTTRQRGDLERAICQDEPGPPSAAVTRPPTGSVPKETTLDAGELARRRGSTPKELRRRLVGDVDTVVLTALRKEPARRYATAGALADDLGRLLARLPVAARPDTWGYRASKLVRRHRGLAAAISALVLVLSAGAVTSTALYLRAERERVASVEREYEARIASAAAAIEAADVRRTRRDLELAPEGRRGWEWRHLFARTDRSDETLAEVEGVILRGVAIDPTGTWMAVGGQDLMVHLFDRASGLEVARAGLSGSFRDPAFLDGGQRLVAVGEGGAAHLWRVPALDAISARPDGPASYTTLAVPETEAWLACGRTDGRIDILDPESLASRSAVGALGGKLQVACNAGGTLLAAVDEEGQLVAWSMPEAERLFEPVPLLVQANSIAISPDSALVAVGMSRGRDATMVHLVEAATGRVVSSVAGHLGPVRGVAFHPAGDRLASAALDETIRVWSVPELRPLQTLLGHGSAISALVHDPITSRLVSVDAIGRVFAWSWGADDVRHWRAPGGWFQGLDISPDGTLIVSTGNAKGDRGLGSIEVHDPRSGTSVWSALLDEPECLGASFSPEGTRLATVTSVGRIQVWDATSGRELAGVWAAGAEAPYSGGGTLGIAWSPDGEEVLTAGPGPLGWAHDARSLEAVRSFDRRGARLAVLSVSSRGDRMVTGGSEGMAALWELSSGRQIATLRGHVGVVFAAAIDPSGELVATGARDCTIRLWSAVDGAELAVMEGHSSYLTDLDFSPDGSRLASSSDDRTVRLWSIPDGREQATLRGHRALVRCVRFAPDGSYLASLSIDGELRIWDAP